ncbi:uncharacterized protein LOC132266008 [Phlebotomus argentipes]|uniref:uncharacterized protein LOC132266008 n=1 Tax=Phlebotomus argentipes TaxID=94469 RepID=UPI0028937853|nr:uncharacterized protein LOC132266008 [Phlebotomus argentipes]
MRDDPIQNLKIVQLVEKYPLLYDNTLKEYDMKQEVEKAWNAIGSELRMAGTIVRDRWRVIRGSYVRYMRQQHGLSDGEAPKKPYYLANYMKFVNPFLKSRESYPAFERKRLTRSRRLKSPREKTTCVIRLKRNSPEECTADQESQPVAEDNSISIIEQYYEDEQNNVEESTAKESDLKHVELYNIAESSSSSHRYTVIQTDKGEDVAKSPTNTDIQWQKVDVEEDTADLHFLKSLLPEMANLTPALKNKFKIQILNSLNNLLYGE